MVISPAGPQGTNPELEEAPPSWTVPASGRSFWNVTLPQLKPTTFLRYIMLTTRLLQGGDQMYMITQGGPAMRP